MLLNFLLIEFISYPERVTKNENAKKNKKTKKKTQNKPKPKQTNKKYNNFQICASNFK